MADNWETLADSGKEPTIPVTCNKWKGEDDDEDVKDSWEDEEEKKDNEKCVQTPPTTATKHKPKSNKSEASRPDTNVEESLDPAEQKLRLQKIQQESDLKNAMDIFGVNSMNNLLGSSPQTAEEFKEFGTSLTWRIAQLKESAHFSQFIEDFVRGLCTHLPAVDIKKVKISVENVYTEKLKLEKQNNKKPAKNKGKASLRTDNFDIDSYGTYDNEYGDEDDFM